MDNTQADTVKEAEMNQGLVRNIVFQLDNIGSRKIFL